LFRSSFRKRRWVIAGVMILAFVLRLWTALHLPEDFDEPIYLQSGFDYAQLLHDGNLLGVIDYPENPEHPPLVRLLYAVGILAQGSGVQWENGLFTSRIISVIFGTLATGLVALVDPLAGLMLAVQTLVVKYTSQAYLEALPMFASIGAVLSIRRSSQSRDKWFWWSALALGLTAAGKYSYFPVLLVVLYILFFEKHYTIGNLIVLLVTSGLTFFAFNPALWNHPLQRFLDSILFHPQYAQSAHVQESGYPWYQPFVWISRSWGFDWHPNVIFYFGFDGLIALFTLGGLALSWKQNRWLIVWAVSGLTFLLLWPTKWPQYTLVLIPAMCLLAAPALRFAYNKIREQEAYWDWFSTMFPRPSRKYMIIGGLVIIGLLFIGGLNALLIGLGKVGWSSITTNNSELPSNIVYDLAQLPDGGIVIATEVGVAFWHPATHAELLDQWTVYTPLNSPLPAARVLSLVVDEEGVVWMGTSDGLARFEAGTWQVFQAAELGLENDQINALAIGNDGRVWVATMGGVAVQSRRGWTDYTRGNSGLISESVFALAVQPQPTGDVLWFGTLAGVSKMDTFTGEWQGYTAKDLNLGWGGVDDLLVDSERRVWVATLGGGISRWDGSQWTTFTTTNSELPFNNVAEISESAPGEYWISVSRPNETGGLLVRVVGDDWHIFRPILTGYGGSEVMAVLIEARTGRIWLATRTMGIYTYSNQR
jgi:hypothetical protein